MIMTADIGVAQLAELVKQVEAGNEIILTQGNKPVARLVAAIEPRKAPREPLQIRSLKGHRVIAPTVSGAELADDMFNRE
jgi:prevent-host-death family protein